MDHELIRSEHGILKPKDIQLFKNAFYGLGFDRDLCNSDQAIFSHSLSSKIVPSVVIPSAMDLPLQTSASLAPLEVKRIQEGALPSFLEMNSDKIILVLPYFGHAHDIELFIHECHQLLGEVERGNIEGRTFNIEDLAFKSFIPLMEKKSKENLLVQRKIIDDCMKSLGKTFLVNIHQNTAPVKFEKCNHLISVCAGSQPAYLFTHAGPSIERCTFIDQNLYSVELWRHLTQNDSLEGFMDFLEIYNFTPGKTPKQLCADIEKTYGSPIENFLQDCRRMKDTEFHWLNFITDEFAISRLLSPNSRPLIWISNSFSSRVNRILFGDSTLNRKFESLIKSIEERLGAHFHVSPHSQHGGTFLDAKNEIIGYLLDDSRRIT